MNDARGGEKNTSPVDVAAASAVKRLYQPAHNVRFRVTAAVAFYRRHHRRQQQQQYNPDSFSFHFVIPSHAPCDSAFSLKKATTFFLFFFPFIFKFYSENRKRKRRWYCVQYVVWLGTEFRGVWGVNPTEAKHFVC